MANTRIRLSPQTIDSVDRLGQQCGIEDQNTLIQLLIRKYGTQLVMLLSPADPIRDSVTQSVPMIAKSNPVVTGLPVEITNSTDIYSNAVENTADYSKPVELPTNETPANDFLLMDF